MAISLNEYEKIVSQMPKTDVGDEVVLTDEDESALDWAWAELAEEEKFRKQQSLLSSDLNND